MRVSVRVHAWLVRVHTSSAELVALGDWHRRAGVLVEGVSSCRAALVPRCGPAAQQIDKLSSSEKYRGRVNFVLCNMSSLEESHRICALSWRPRQPAVVAHHSSQIRAVVWASKRRSLAQVSSYFTCDTRIEINGHRDRAIGTSCHMT